MEIIKDLQSFQYFLDADFLVSSENASSFLAKVSEHFVESWACSPYSVVPGSLVFNLRLPAGRVLEDGALASFDSLSLALSTLDQFSDLGDVIRVSSWSPDFLKFKREDVSKK